MTSFNTQFGVLDNRFLSRSLGLLNPKPPVTINATDSVKIALAALKENKIGSLVIVDDFGKLVGIFTERDAILKVCLSDLDVENTPISEIMTASPHTEQMTSTIAYALNMMSHGGYRHIPIVDDGEFPVALISVKDIVDYIAVQLAKDLGAVPNAAR